MTCVDILIASYEHTDIRVLNRCLESIRYYTHSPHRVIVERSEHSAARNRNTLIHRSSSEFICFLDDDVSITSQWLGGLLSILRTQGRNSIVMPKLMLENGRIFNIGVQDTGGMIRPVGYGSLDSPSLKGIREVDLAGTTCLLLTRDMLKKAGFFDECFEGSQWEDIDFAQKLKLAGGRFFVNLDVTVIHRNLFRQSRYASNEKKYLGRWKAFSRS